MSLQLTRRILFALILLVPSCICLAQNRAPAKSVAEAQTDASLAEFDPKNWKTFSSSEGRFSVLVPTTPQKLEKQVLSLLGNVTSFMFIARTNAEYGVTYADYDPEIEGTDLLATFMDSVRDSGIQGVNGRLLDETALSQEGHPARFYRVEFGGGYVMNAKMLIVKNRLYLITVTGYGKKGPAEVARVYESFAKKFFDSFKLTSGEPEMK